MQSGVHKKPFCGPNRVVQIWPPDVPSGKWLVASQNEMSWRCRRPKCMVFVVLTLSLSANCLFTLHSSLPRKGGEAHCEKCSLIGGIISIPARYWTPIGLPLPDFKLRRIVFSSFSRSSRMPRSHEKHDRFAQELLEVINIYLNDCTLFFLTKK